MRPNANLQYDCHQYFSSIWSFFNIWWSTALTYSDYLLTGCSLITSLVMPAPMSGTFLYATALSKPNLLHSYHWTKLFQGNPDTPTECVIYLLADDLIHIRIFCSITTPAFTVGNGFYVCSLNPVRILSLVTCRLPLLLVVYVIDESCVSPCQRWPWLMHTWTNI